MKVQFQRGFFIEGHFFHPHRVVTVPDRFANRLPTSAQVHEDAPARPRRRKNMSAG